MQNLDYRQLAKKLFGLYVMTTKKYLLQDEKAYTTQYYPLNDYLLIRHLKGDKTIGVLLGAGGLTKFLCFDVDVKHNPAKAKEVTRRLVSLLMLEYGIQQKDIHVSESGGKGYHIELFFDKAIPYTYFEPFYKEILYKLDENIHTIEQRPTTKGVKIPLGVHRGTKKVCYYVNPISLKPIKNKNYVLSIVPLDYEEFKAKILDSVEDISVNTFKLEHNEGQQTENLLHDVKIDDKSLEDIEKDILKVLQNNRLSYAGTRHKLTLQIAKYYYSQGEEKEIAYEVIKNVMMNSKDFINPETTNYMILEDIDRTVNDVYSKGYLLRGARTEIEITKAEILQILAIKELHLKKLLLSMLIHSKKFKKKNNAFTMSLSIMKKYGNTLNEGRLIKYLKLLEQMGKIKILEHGVIDEVRSKAEKTFLYKPNVYEITLNPAISEEEQASITIKSDFKADLIELVPKLIPKKEIKKILTPDVFKKTWSKHYREKNFS
jgi:hypothetical protein